MSKRIINTYDFRVDVLPANTNENSKGTAAVSFTGFVYGVRGKDAARDKFLVDNFLVARKNGIVRGTRQAQNNMKLTQIARHRKTIHVEGIE